MDSPPSGMYSWSIKLDRMGLPSSRTARAVLRRSELGVAERWIESCRRDLLDHVIAMNEPHLKRLLTEYVAYYHEDRTHLELCKQTPSGRPRVEAATASRVISQAWLGG